LKSRVQGLAEELLGRLEVLLPFGQRPLEEEQVGAVFLAGGERRGLRIGVVGVLQRRIWV